MGYWGSLEPGKGPFEEVKYANLVRKDSSPSLSSVYSAPTRTFQFWDQECRVGMGKGHLQQVWEVRWAQNRLMGKGQ